jgi:hypothetical protein
MKTKLSPLLTAFDALDLALRVAGVLGGLAAVASHLPSRHAPGAEGASAAAYRDEATQARSHAMHARARIVRVQAGELAAPPLPPVLPPDEDVD